MLSRDSLRSLEENPETRVFLEQADREEKEQGIVIQSGVAPQRAQREVGVVPALPVGRRRRRWRCSTTRRSTTGP